MRTFPIVNYVAVLGTFGTIVACASGESSVGDGSDEVRATAATLAAGTFKMYGDHNHISNARCDIYTQLVFSTVRAAPRATLGDAVTGFCLPAIRPPTVYPLTYGGTECGTKLYRGQAGTSTIVVHDNRARTCGDAPQAQVVVEETTAGNVTRTLFSQDSPPSLPTCPYPCGADVTQNGACVTGDACGTPIGDGATCSAGKWQVAVHAPLGRGDNHVCQVNIADRCSTKVLDTCPQPCGNDVRAGGACTTGQRCGDVLGDGASCVAGKWERTVHPPLGLGCNSVCRPLPKSECDDLSLPTCPPACPSESQCTTEGAICGSDIGDQSICKDGTWRTNATHRPLGLHCNLTCRRY